MTQQTVAQSMVDYCDQIKIHGIALLLVLKLLIISQLCLHNHANMSFAIFFVTMTITTCAMRAKQHVEFFNKLALDFHIAAKQLGMFVNTSPCQPPAIGCCEQCQSTLLQMIDGEQVCNGCGFLTREEDAMSWADVTRVQSLPRYSYDRTVQFKDHMLQLQGLGKIDTDLFNNLLFLRTEFRLTKIQFAAKVKQLSKQRNHMDQIHCLYYQIYKKQPIDFVDLENQILVDFEKYSTSFNQDHASSGKPFSNNQLLLFHLLKRHHVKIVRADLMIGAGVVDTTMKKLFSSLGWRMAG